MCENGVSAEWNLEYWGLVNIQANGNSKIKCSINFKELIPIAEYITNLATTSSEIVDDETEDHNLRYIGADPNNYVSFNNELWRIIGVMKDVADESGTIEPRIKLIRSESIGYYSWDNKGTYGSSDWSYSAIQEVLNNGAYYNRTNGNCPNRDNGSTTSDFSDIGLNAKTKSMISSVKWKLGGTASYESSSSGLASNWYGNERGTTVYSGHATEWIGEVGLMYPSDYGYATGGGSTTDRSTCLNTYLVSWNGSEVSDCKNNDWLYNSSRFQWTITPYSVGSNHVFYVNSTGHVDISSTSLTADIRPSVYLSTSTKIVSGTGTSSDPFILSK